MEKIDLIKNEFEKIIQGKSEQIELALTNILANGHTLIEDTPGVGKTTLVKVLSKVFGLQLSRIQFTNDLLPSDILGYSVFNKQSSEFNFHKGPIFGEIILADELNRASAKTQSALLQAMEERKVSIESQTYNLPNPSFVIATQNPNVQMGTYPLPESQLDRFSLKMSMGFPDKQSTLKLLKMEHSESNLEKIKTIMNKEELQGHQKKVFEVSVHDDIYELIIKLLEISRNSTKYISLSNRAAIDLVKVSKAYAYIKSRTYLIPDDLFYLFPYVCGHRLVHPDHSDVQTEQNFSSEILNQLK